MISTRTLCIAFLMTLSAGALSCRPEIRGATDSASTSESPGDSGGGGGGSGTTTVSWSFVDSGGINKNHTQYSSSAQLTVFNSKLYSTWAENNGSNIGQIRIAVYNNNDSAPSWTFVDGNGANGINKDTAKVASTPQLTAFNSKLYITWSEVSSAVAQIRVSVYNGDDSSPSWTRVDGGGADGINKDVTRAAITPQLTSFNSKLYVIWSEKNAGNISQIRVAVYNGNDGAPTWTKVDGDGANGINKSVTSDATEPQLTEFNSKLYASWGEDNAGTSQIRIVVYGGNDGAPSWTFVDGNGATGINKNSSKRATSPQLTPFNSKLYATWEELGSSVDQIRAVVYNGSDGSPAWSFIDGNGTNGLNKDTTKSAYTPQLTVLGSELFLIWAELNSDFFGQIRVKLYNGDDSSPTWTFMDGGGINGLNRDTAKNAYEPQLTAIGTKLYGIWQEQTATSAGEIMIKLGVPQ